MSFQFWGARCVLGTSLGCAPLAGCRALPLPLALSQGAGGWLLQPLLGPSPHLPRGFAGPTHPRKAGRVTSAIATGTRHPTFTNEERRLRRTRPWPWWTGHPWNSAGPHPELDAQGWWEDRDPKHRSIQTCERAVRKKRRSGDPEAEMEGRQGGQSAERDPRAIQSPGSREGGDCKGGGLPDKIQKIQLNLNFPDCVGSP